MRCAKFFLPVVLALAMIFLPAQVSAEVTTVILVRHGQTTYNGAGTSARFSRHPAQRQRNCSGETFGKKLEGLSD